MPQDFGNLGEGCCWRQSIIVVLALKTVPDTEKSFSVGEACNVNTQISCASNSDDLSVLRFLVVNPFFDKFFPLGGRVKENVLLRQERSSLNQPLSRRNIAVRSSNFFHF